MYKRYFKLVAKKVNYFKILTMFNFITYMKIEYMVSSRKLVDTKYGLPKL